MSVLDQIRRLRPWGRRAGEAAPPGMVPADKLAARAWRDAAAPAPVPAHDRELLAQRDRLAERFTMMQADLGGVFYEMAIRDHVRMDVLTRKAAELQRVDADLARVERELRGEPAGPPVGSCATCGAPYAAGSRFCASCGHVLGTPAAAAGEAPTLHDIARTNGSGTAG